MIELVPDEGRTRARLAADDADVLLVDRAIWVLNESGQPWTSRTLRMLVPDVPLRVIAPRLSAALDRGDMESDGFVWRGVE